MNTERRRKDYPCLHCGEFLCGIFLDDGSRTPDSAALKEDGQHGGSSICLNPKCRREIHMDEPMRGVWLPSRRP